jgi:hypothetical protein
VAAASTAALVLLFAGMAGFLGVVVYRLVAGRR